MTITVDDLYVKHRCSFCDYFQRKKVYERETSWRECVRDLLSLKNIRLSVIVEIRENWCSKYNRQVDPKGKLPCFEYTGSEEIWIPYYHVTVGEGGKLKVAFEK